MHGQDASGFLESLAIVLCVAAITTVAFQRIRQPVVLGYVLAGMIIGPHVPIPLVADPEAVQTLSDLGVILLVFSLGLEFNLRRLVRIGRSTGLIAVVEVSMMLWIGFVIARAFGWNDHQAAFTAAAVAISSTTITVKTFDEHGVRGHVREVVFGVLVVEDLLAILLLAALTPIAAGSAASAESVAMSAVQLVGFLLVLVVVGILVVPRTIRAIVTARRSETILVASIGLCFATALLARELGYSEALGAFIAGSLVAESGAGKTIEPLVKPVRDVFVAIFFVSVGLRIDPELVGSSVVVIAIFTAVVVCGKIVGVTLGAFLTGRGPMTALTAGMSLAHIGEFSFIIAGLGATSGAVDASLYPAVVAISVVTTFTAPWLVRASGPLTRFVDQRLPTSIRTFIALYGAWLEDLRRAPSRPSAAQRMRRLARLLLLDAFCIASIAIGTSLYADGVASTAADMLGVTHELASELVVVTAFVISLPFFAGIVRLARRLGTLLADAALPEAPTGGLDLAAAPRKALRLTLQLTVVLVVGAPLLAITQPFLPSFQAAFVLGAALLVLGVAFWRSTTNLQGHVRAGAQVVAELLAERAAAPQSTKDEPSLQQMHDLLPGLGAPVPVRIEPTSPAIGKTLRELDLHALTATTVLAIIRGQQGVLVPTDDEVVSDGDVVALAGSHEAVSNARRLLCKNES